MLYENWQSSKDKWELIVKNIESENCYDSEQDSFESVSVGGHCGYCKEYDKLCRECPIYDLCGSFASAYDEVLGLLRDGRYEEALPNAKKILDFIIADEPAKPL